MPLHPPSVCHQCNGGMEERGFPTLCAAPKMAAASLSLSHAIVYTPVLCHGHSRAEQNRKGLASVCALQVQQADQDPAGT